MIYTYLVFDKLSGLTKIGKTKDLKSRLSTLSTSNLNLGLIYAEAIDVEKELHLLFKDKKARKEWFDLTKEEVKAAIEIINNKKEQLWS